MLCDRAFCDSPRRQHLSLKVLTVLGMNSVRFFVLLVAAFLATSRAAKRGRARAPRERSKERKGIQVQPEPLQLPSSLLELPTDANPIPPAALGTNDNIQEQHELITAISKLQLQDFPEADLATGEAACQTDLSVLLGVQLDQLQTAEGPGSSLSASAPNESGILGSMSLAELQLLREQYAMRKHDRRT